MTIPNALTFLRLLLVPCFLGASYRGMFDLALVIFITAALTDVFDGWIARRLNQRSRLGAILDPAVDKTMLVCGYLFYTFQPRVRMRIPGWLTFVILLRDCLIVLFAYLIYTRIRVKRFPPSWPGKASTLLQAITLSFAIAVNGSLAALSGATHILFRLAMVMTLYSGWDYLRRWEQVLDQNVAAHET